MLTAEEGDWESLKSQIFELIRQLFEEKIGGADLGDVFSLPGEVLTLVLDGDSLVKTTDGLKVGQSDHIADADGSLGDATTKINAILDLLTERGLMA